MLGEHVSHMLPESNRRKVDVIIAIGEDAVLSIDPDLNFCFWNQKAEQLFGHSEKEIMGQSINLLLPTSASDAHTESIQVFSGDKSPSKFMGERGEIIGLHKSGARIALEASITKTFIGNRLIMSAQIRDISDRKQAQKILEEREARFGAVFDHAVEAIALLDASGLVLDINSAARERLPVSVRVGIEPTLP